jgi:hypothetical protein
MKKHGVTVIVKAMLLPAAALLLVSCMPEQPDYNLYENMSDYFEQRLSAHGATARDDMPDLFTSEHIRDLTGLVRIMFGSPQLEVHLSSYESSAVAVASYSMFEVPPDSAVYTDFAFTIRPAAGMKAPILHGDALKAMPGMPGSFELSFLDVNKDVIDSDAFLGDQVEKINEALELVEPYQRQEEDRGKYVQYLKDHMDERYRIEVDETYIQDATEEARMAYYDAILQAYKLYVDAYFTSLERLASEDAAFIETTKNNTDAFIDLVYENDVAAQLGKLLFGEDFDAYFLEGFWRDQYYGADL